MRRSRLTATFLLLLFWVLAAAGCAGQDVAKGKAAPAEKASPAAPSPVPTPPAPVPATPTPAPAAAAEPKIGSPWHDGVHYVGLAGAGLAGLAFIAGVAVFVGFEVRGKRWDDPSRRRLRALHMACGVSGALLALAHHVGRLVQNQELILAHSPPFLAGYGFALLLISGVLRYRTPKALRKVWQVFPWLHRLGVVVALVYMFRHVRYQWLQFGNDSH
ncbi:MAG: hypothetical protein KKI08_12095 [Armatimonadetes bacterium]|nr:hypothetical protein [Armatimonadota bacterium]